jgi:hypothetical protein
MTSPRQGAAMIRRTLPQRRAAETFDLRFRNQLFTVTVGFYADGTPGEVFIDGKPGTTSRRSRATPPYCSASRSSTGFLLKQFATLSPAAGRKRQRRLSARSSTPSRGKTERCATPSDQTRRGHAGG